MALARVGRAARLGIHLPELKSKSVEYVLDAEQSCPDGDFVCPGHCGFRNRDMLGNMITGEQVMLLQAPCGRWRLAVDGEGDAYLYDGDNEHWASTFYEELVYSVENEIVVSRGLGANRIGLSNIPITFRNSLVLSVFAFTGWMANLEYA